ncbi:MAG TPA: TlpA disulfide reductase family protein [Abditibacteriaceae bacterium]|jgi:thiol-disulfide isomerase/thioredoxin
MDKWKGLVIIALLAGLGGYGYVSSRPLTPPAPTPDAASTANTAPTPSPAAAAVAARFVGKPLPAWDFPAAMWVNSEKPVTPQTLKGSVTLVEFFRIGCSHCVEAAPFMQQIQQTYGRRGLKMVAIQSPGKSDPDENNWETVKTRIKEWKWTHPVAFDKGGNTFRDVYGLKIFPTVMVADKDGIVRYFKTGYTPESAAALMQFLDGALPQPK